MIAATIAAVGWWRTGRPTVAAAALAAGVLPDVDHLVDYAYYYLRRRHRLILPLHGYEYAAAAAGAALMRGSAPWGVAALSYLVHLLADQAENRTRPWGYSLICRAAHGFCIERISTMPADAKRGRMNDMAALKRLLRRPRK